MNVLFLCTELSGYFVNCIRVFGKQQQCRVIVIHYPNPSIAPFEFNNIDVEMILHDAMTTDELLAYSLSLHPSIVYVSGWMDKAYVRIARILKKNNAVVVAGVDNPWRGTLRQHLASFLSPIYVEPAFTYLWVAGKSQYKFARKLGYASNRILTGLYAADVEKFNRIAANRMDKLLVFVGRLESIKGVEILERAFHSLTSLERNGWKLLIIGNGPLKSQLLPGDDMEVCDFVQPEVLIDMVAYAGGFVLPSLHEPWGVVVHEFAAAGKPLILSDQINSGELFLVPTENGYQFKAGDADDLKSKLKLFFNLPATARIQMGNKSYQLAQQWNASLWAKMLASVLQLQ